MGEETKIPSNHVVGVISGSKSADDAVSRLQRAGYDDVLVMHHVDKVGEGVNPLSALLERLSGHLSDEVGYLDQYQEATEKGDVVLAVGAEQGDQADRVREIMELEGAVNIRYFGKLAVTDMTPPTNPSAASDVQPQGPPKHPESG
jgi:hypothetical protein